MFSRKFLTRCLCVLLVACAFSDDSHAEPAKDATRLTIDRIYKSKEFDSKSVSARWLDDSSGFTSLESSEGDAGGRDIVKHSLGADDQPEVLVSAEDLVPPGHDQPLAIDDFVWSKNQDLILIYTNSKRVWRRKTRGDYWIYDRSSHELWQLGGPSPGNATLMFAKLADDGRKVAYVRDRNIYVEDIQSRAVQKITKTGKSTIINGTFDWVYEEEFGLRDGFRWSPDSQRIAYWQINTKGVKKFTMINNTQGLYPRLTRFAYPKVGQQNPSCRVGVVDIQQKNTVWMQVPGDARQNYIARMQWAEDSERLLLQQLNRYQNQLKLWLAKAGTGRAETLLTETDAAWINLHDDPNWIYDGQKFDWQSERDGWNHLYLVSLDGQQQQITSGEMDVIRFLHLDPQHGAYVLASPENATQRHLFLAPLDGGEPKRLGPGGRGSHEYVIAPSGRFAIHTSSRFGRPPTSKLISLPDHKTIRTLEKNKKLRRKLRKLKLGETEMFQVEIESGIQLDGWCIRPAEFDESKTYPLLVHVYGEPAGQTVLDRWGGSSYLWHQMLAQHGYCVMSFDNRGTPAPKGREWRKCVYKQVGILAPQEQAAAVKSVLAKRPYLDSKRVGLWGWSGGGSMTLNGLFKFPDLYSAGISIAPVPNQRHYDTIYQERYMGLPSENVDGFRQGSPINFAHQLKGKLLLIHGTADDNVHYQGTEALVNRLIRHNKQFSMMAYPNRSHSIREGRNTTRHLRTLMTNWLFENLPHAHEN